MQVVNYNFFKKNFKIKFSLYSPFRGLGGCFFLFLILLTFPVKANITNLKQDLIAPGLIHHSFIKHLTRGKVIINILEIDTSAGYSIRPALAKNGSIWGRETLQRITQRENAIAAINANYFSNSGMPIGALAIDKEWITGPVLNRATFSIDANGKVYFARPQVSGKIYKNSKYSISQSVNTINQPDSLNSKGITFYNHWWDDKISCGEGRACLLVDGKGIIRKKISTSDSINIFYPTRSDYVLSAKSDGFFEELFEADKIFIKWHSDPDWSQMIHAIGGGPYLLKDGQIILNESLEGFSNKSGVLGVAPRTALGITRPNRIILLTADGRQENSVGMSLNEVAQLLKEIGVKDAINLDGGGSTTMVIDGNVINHPSDKGVQRKVSTALIILKSVLP